MDVRDTVLDDFKTLVREQGMSEDNVIIRQNKGTTRITTHLLYLHSWIWLDIWMTDDDIWWEISLHCS